MVCQVVNNQSNLQARLPQIPQAMPTNQAAWSQFTQILQAWGIALQQQQYPPNVVPTQFQTFSAASATPVLAALTAVSCTPSIDTGNQFYGTASLKVASISAGATLSLSGTPIPISPGTRWFVAFQMLAPSGCTGSLTVTTNGGHSVTESFSVPASGSWQGVWGLFDLSQWGDVQATIKFTFTSTANVNIDGLQMNAIGKTLAFLPSFHGTQMILGAVAYSQNLDGVPDGATYERIPAANLDGTSQRGIDPTRGGISAKGSTPPILPDIGFSWTTTSGQVVITWPSFTLFRSDGSTTTVSSGSQTVTGLTNGTVYTVYPFVIDGQTVVKFAQIVTGAGSPPMCFAGGVGSAAAIAYENANIPLNSFTVTPSASGGGGGGNHVGCIHPATKVLLADGRKIRASELTVDMMLPGPQGPTRITHIKRARRREWITVYFADGGYCSVTLDHRFIRPDGTQVRAKELHIGEILAGPGRNTWVELLALLEDEADMVSLNVEAPHLYFLAGALSHNGNPKP